MTEDTLANLRACLEDWAVEAGLVCLGVVAPDVGVDFTRFTAWLAEGRQAGMGYMSQHLACRSDPRQLLEGAKAAIVVGLPYNSGDTLASPKGPRIAQYARYVDYHKTMRKKGEALLARLLDASDQSQHYAGRVVVDTAPLLERALAAQTSAGFVGKNTCYIHPRHGSMLLLGEILVTLPLAIDSPGNVDPGKRTSAGGCGTCRRCQVHCPTGALDEDYRLDARRCLSYWTIEHRGPVPEEFWPHFARYWYGCDICQLACPYHRASSARGDPAYLRIKTPPSLNEVATMSQAQYEAWFGGTPMTRAKREGLRRNAFIAMAVTADPLLDAALVQMEHDSTPVLEETKRQIERWRAKTT